MTPQQKRVLEFIEKQIRDMRISPSYDEICAAIGAKSKSSAHRIVTALVRDGHIVRTPGLPRNIRLAPSASGRTASREVMAAAERVLDSIVFENRRAGIVTVGADAIDALDVAVAERRAGRRAA